MRAKSFFEFIGASGLRRLVVPAAAMLAAIPITLRADVVSVSQTNFFEEAGFAPLFFTINPDGTVSCFDTGGGCFIATSASASWDLAANGQVFPGANLTPLDFPALPPGSTINSAMFSWDVSEGVNPFPGNITFNLVGSLGLELVNGPCGGAVSSDSGSCSFMPGSTGETTYAPEFSGGSNAMLVADIPTDPGTYTGGGNIGVVADYTVTVDYSATPEPAYGFPLGLGIAGLFAAAFRARRGRALSGECRIAK
jgi:hypothetical protein